MDLEVWLQSCWQIRVIRFDAIIHNAGVYQVSNRLIFAVNTLAPYLLTSLIQRPERLIYLSSGMHLQGDPGLKNFSHNTGAPDDLEKGAETQEWLAVSNDKEARVSGRYFYHMKEKHFLREAGEPVLQEKFLAQSKTVHKLYINRRSIFSNWREISRTWIRCFIHSIYGSVSGTFSSKPPTVFWNCI